MPSVHEFPGETVPSDEELSIYTGLLNIRLRKNGNLVVGFFITEKTHEPVLTIAAQGASGGVHRIPIEPEVANLAFEEPWSYVDATSRALIEEILNNNDSAA